jgi:hypothetical protein
MIDTRGLDIDAYVRAALPTLGLEMPAERVAAVAEAFKLVVSFATPALERDVPAETEPAPVFEP